MIGGARFIRALPYVIAGAAASYLYYLAANFQFHERPGTLGPDFWPEAILALMIVTCLFKIVAGLVARNDAAEIGGVLEEIIEESVEEHTAGSPPGAPVLESHPYLLIAGMALTAGYVIFIQRLGFFIATVLYLALFIVLGGYRRWAVVAAVSVGGTLLLLFFFMKVVYVSLPIGQVPFSAVTLFLMQVMGIR
ncbi:MAG: tripartite tricarboxylate transporter TctB family protein [Betaproteobacteria bacterium]|nr:tripartite tricarboxylate transporter TctB family protein [Betaproteobacteria bacterium]